MGKVYLVGAGPGDPELITVKGAKILAKADVVIYDRLVNPETLKYASNAKELICVGKRRGESWKQEEINKLLVEKAENYDVVVRLKNGDPLLLARGGEECEALRNSGIEYEIIPGITSALAAPAYAGIPVTHREYSSSIAITTGHRREGTKGNLDYLTKILEAVDTTIILMGATNLRRIIERALEAGLPSSTPVAVIENATLKNQRTTTGSLGNILELAEERGVKAPAVIVIGETVKLHEKLRWLRE